MYLFILTFFLLYGAMHLYVFLKAKVAFAFSAGVALYIILFMLLMVLAPFIVRLSEKYGFESFARLMSYIGYIWLGVLFLFFSSSIVLDVYRVCVYLIGIISHKDLSVVIPPARLSFFMPLVISICTATYGYFEALNIRTEKITIKTSKIPKEIGTLRIVQISDVHLGLIVREGRLKKILKEVELANPDILVSTGDLVDGQIDSMEGLAELLLKIKPKYGKFAITGNHEFYAGLSHALSFTEKAGFRILRGEGLTVAGFINIAGVDDPAGKPSGQYKEISERELLSGLLHEKFTLFLKHRPFIDKDALGFFDLQLSGHTHKGQIFPFSIVTWMYYPVAAGCLNPIDHCYLYVSRGSGTWGPPIRFLSPPEVTVIELVSQ